MRDDDEIPRSAEPALCAEAAVSESDPWQGKPTTETNEQADGGAWNDGGDTTVAHAPSEVYVMPEHLYRVAHWSLPERYQHFIERHSIVSVHTAESVNAELHNRARESCISAIRNSGLTEHALTNGMQEWEGMWFDPYRIGTYVIEYELREPQSFLRCHGDSLPSERGRWLASPTDLPSRMTPLELERQFAIMGQRWTIGPDDAKTRPYRPDADVEAGTITDQATTISTIQCQPGVHIRVGEFNRPASPDHPLRADAVTGGQAPSWPVDRHIWQFELVGDRSDLYATGKVAVTYGQPVYPEDIV